MNPTVRSETTLRAYLVGAYLFSVPAFAYSESSGLLIIPQITGAVLVAYALLDILRSLKITIPGEIGLYSLMGLWAVITYLFGASPSERGTLSLGSLIKVVIVTLACAQLIKDESDFFTAMKIFVFSIILVYYQNMSDLHDLRFAGEFAETDRFAGTLANANNAAILALTIIWASILLMLRSSKSLLKRAFLFVPIGISLLIIYYSGSKKGLIGLAFFVLFLTRLLYIRVHSSFKRRILVLLASSALIILAGYFIYTSPFFFRIKQIYYGGSGSDINRLKLAGEAIHVWLMNWKTFFLGVGYDNFRAFSSLQTYAHSTPFELLASNGIIGFSLFFGFLSILFRKFILLYRNIPDQESKSIYFSTLIFFFIYSIFMIAAVMHESRELMPIMGCLAAYGQFGLRRLGQGQVFEVSPAKRED